MLRFGDQQREHRLVAAMDAVEVADRQGAGGGDSGVVEAAKHLHAAIIGRTLRLAQKPTMADSPATQVRPGAGSKNRALPSLTMTEPA